jgi:predicted DNA-binding protein
MPSPTQPRASRQVTVRLDPAHREHLDALAATSDRTLAQLVRYALTAYFESNPTCPVPGRAETDETSRHLAVRITTILADQVEAHAKACNVTTSDVIRDAISVWITNANTDNLGTPAVAIDEKTEV